MSKADKIKTRVLDHQCRANIPFDDLRHLAISLGFEERIRGSHHIFSRKDLPVILNLQPARDGKAKSWQVRQMAELLVRLGIES